jgi:hypothetical protein
MGRGALGSATGGHGRGTRRASLLTRFERKATSGGRLEKIAPPYAFQARREFGTLEPA